jgi:hypothetical protein
MSLHSLEQLQEQFDDKSSHLAFGDEIELGQLHLGALR